MHASLTTFFKHNKNILKKVIIFSDTCNMLFHIEIISCMYFLAVTTGGTV